MISLPGPAHPNLYLAVTWTVIAGDITARNTDERVIDSTISPISTSALDTTTFLNFGLFCLEISDELIFYHMMIHKYPKRIPVHIFLYYLMKIFAMILQVFVIFLMVISVGFFGTLLSQVSSFVLSNLSGFIASFILVDFLITKLQDMLIRLRRDALSADEYFNSVSALLRGAKCGFNLLELLVATWV